MLQPHLDIKSNGTQMLPDYATWFCWCDRTEGNRNLSINTDVLF